MRIYLNSEETHSKQVNFLQKEILINNQNLSLLNSSASNTMRDGVYKRKTHALDLDKLDKVLTVDREEKWVSVEPRVTIKKLVESTYPYELIPPIVPEFTSITVGGAIMGAALESGSHYYGQFNDCSLEYELLLGNGDLITASPLENSDLFYALSGSYGTLAILTRVKIRLIDAKSHVLISYTGFSKQQELLAFLSRRKEEGFLEGLILSKNLQVGIEAKMVEHSSKYPLFRQRYPWQPWFYQHVAQITEKESEYKELMPLKEYLFRLDRGAFWMGRFLLSYPLILKTFFRYRLKNIGNALRTLANSLTRETHPSFPFRLLFGWLLSSKRLYKLWHQVPTHISENFFFVQDFYAPIEKSAEILETFEEKTGIFPIWLCPILGTQTPQLLSPHYGGERFLNIGLYGIPKSPLSIPELTKEMELMIARYGGRKMLYSMTYYSEESFRKIYDLDLYESLRKKYHAERFLPLYNKVVNMV